MLKTAAAMDDHHGSLYLSGKVHSYCGDSIIFGETMIAELTPLNGNYFIAFFSQSRKFYSKSLATLIAGARSNHAKSLYLLDFPPLLIRIDSVAPRLL